MLQFSFEQFQQLNALAFKETEKDIALAIREHFGSSWREEAAIDVIALSPSDLARFIHQIVEIGSKYGFMLRGELYALVEACVIIGPKNLLAQPVLEHSGLTAEEKVQVMLDLYRERRSLKDPLS